MHLSRIITGPTAHHIATTPGEHFGTAAARPVRTALTVKDTAFGNALCRFITFAQDITP